MEGAATSVIRGPSFFANRYEGGTTVYSFTGTTSQTAVPPCFIGNIYISDAGTLFNNPNNLYMSVQEFSVTPDSDPKVYWDGDPYLFRNIKSNTNAASFRPQTAGYGIDVTTASDTLAAKLVTRAGGGGQLGFSNQLGQVTGVGSISKTSTGGDNLRGSVTLSSGTASVSFGTAEPDSSYYVVVTGNAAETFYVTSKATSGFTITSSNGSSTANVDWILIR